MPFFAPPQTWPHSLIIGDTYRPVTVTLKDGDDVPYDLTGVTGEVVLQRSGVTILTPTFSLVDAAAGQFTWTSPAGDTEDLVPQVARYYVRLTWPDDTVRTVLEGDVTIRTGVI
jgi:hypothetical protein